MEKKTTQIRMQVGQGWAGWHTHGSELKRQRNESSGLIYWHGFGDKAVGFCTTRFEASKKPLTALATAKSSLLSLPLDCYFDSSAGFY